MRVLVSWIAHTLPYRTKFAYSSGKPIANILGQPVVMDGRPVIPGGVIAPLRRVLREAFSAFPPVDNHLLSTLPHCR